MCSCPARSRSAGSLLPGVSRPTRIAVPSRSTVSSKVVAVIDRLEDRLGGGAALHPDPKVLPVVHSRAAVTCAAMDQRQEAVIVETERYRVEGR